MQRDRDGGHLARAARAFAAHWPNRCAVCHDATRGADGRVCAACAARFAPPRARCLRCALPLAGAAEVCGRCLREPPPWRRALAAFDYGYPWDGLLTALKFHAALDLVPALAARLAARVVAGTPSGVDLLLPVPLARERLRERGYNQAALLADALAARLRLASRRDALLRLRETPHQIALPRERRAANVRGAFAVEPLALGALRGRQVALVDDVMTTGATLAEVAGVLRAAGVEAVEVWVLARTPDH